MSLSDALSTERSKYTPGERTSWETTTRSVPLITKVPRSVISGKSPMNTVWLLISPVVVFMNSAVTKSGAEYVMSRSLHSSIEYLGGSNRWSRNDSDIDPEKSSIGEISSKISSRPEVVGTLCLALSSAASTRACHLELPRSQSKLSVCRARRFGTSSGSPVLPEEIRPGAVRGEPEGDAVREAAKRGPSTGLRALRAHAETPRT